MQTEKTQYALQITFETATWGRYFHAQASVVVVDPQYNSDPAYLGFRSVRDDYHEEKGFADLVARSQSDEHSGNKEPASYAWCVEYHRPHSVDASRAEVMHKTLRTVEKKMKTYAEKFGPCHTFGSYVVRFAQAVGASAIYVQTRKDTRSYLRIEPGEAVYYVDSRINDWCKENHPVST